MKREKGQRWVGVGKERPSRKEKKRKEKANPPPRELGSGVLPYSVCPHEKHKHVPTSSFGYATLDRLEALLSLDAVLLWTPGRRGTRRIMVCFGEYELEEERGEWNEMR